MYIFIYSFMCLSGPNGNGRGCGEQPRNQARRRTNSRSGEATPLELQSAKLTHRLVGPRTRPLPPDSSEEERIQSTVI